MLLLDGSVLKLAMGVLGVAVTTSAYYVMIWKTLAGEARPHPVAWYGFGAFTAIGFFVQWQKGAGAGSWVLGLTFVACFVVGAISQWKGRWHTRDFDGLGLGRASSWAWLRRALCVVAELVVRAARVGDLGNDGRFDPVCADL